MRTLRRKVFEEQVGKTLLLHRPDGEGMIIFLKSVEEGRSIPSYECFTLWFEPPKGQPALPDGTYLIENDAIGRVPIFISATKAPDPDPLSYYYESVFNIYLDECLE